MNRLLFIIGVFLIIYGGLGGLGFIIKFIFIKVKNSHNYKIEFLYNFISYIFINKYITEETRSKLKYDNNYYNFRFDNSYIKFNDNVYSLKLQYLVKCFKSNKGEEDLSLLNLGIWIFDESKQDTVLLFIINYDKSDNSVITDKYDKKFVRNLIKSIKSNPDNIQFKCDGFFVEEFFRRNTI